MSKLIKKIICVILLTIFTSGCSCFKSNSTNKIEFYKGDIEIIESSTFNNTSYLKLYNLNGKLVQENKVNCVDINSGFLSPITYNDNVYTNSIGGYSNRSKKVLQFDLKNNEYKTHEIAEGIFTVTAEDNFIFTSNSPPSGSIITKYNIETQKKEKELKVPGLVQHLVFNQKLLYAFSDSDNGDGSITISVINPNTMEVKKSINIKGDQSVFDSVNVGENIFYTHMIAEDGRSPSKTLSEFDTEKNIVKNITLNENYPDHIKKYKNKLLITHYDAVRNIGNKLTELDLTTNKQKLISFNHKLSQIEVKGDKFFACDYDNIYVYDLNNFKLLYKFKVSDNRKDYRINGFFFTK